VANGAYGEVWLARNAIGILHAVKIIYRRAFESPEPYDREFRGITQFMPISRSHPGFVHVLHVGRDDPAGYFYYVMEIADDAVLGQEIQVEGYSPKNLSSELKRRKRLRPDECLQLGACLAAALEQLHEAGLIHRDIKPSNIIFVRGVPKLADIGLVTRIALDPKDISYLGTRGYIAPEGPGTPQADVYSLGKVLYEAFTGLDREQFPSLPTTLLENPDNLFTRLNQTVLKACEPNPARRYQSAAELHQALDALKTRVAAPSP
jgi:serine/threonine protein kinase